MHSSSVCDFGIKGMLFYQENLIPSATRSILSTEHYVQDLRDKFGEHFTF